MLSDHVPTQLLNRIGKEQISPCLHSSYRLVIWTMNEHNTLLGSWQFFKPYLSTTLISSEVKPSWVWGGFGLNSRSLSLVEIFQVTSEKWYRPSVEGGIMWNRSVVSQSKCGNSGSTGTKEDKVHYTTLDGFNTEASSKPNAQDPQLV